MRSSSAGHVDSVWMLVPHTRQSLRYLLMGTLDLDDSLVYSLYRCLQCKQCEIVCESKGQSLEICSIIQLGRSLLSQKLEKGESDAAI